MADEKAVVLYDAHNKPMPLSVRKEEERLFSATPVFTSPSTYVGLGKNARADKLLDEGNRGWNAIAARPISTRVSGLQIVVERKQVVDGEVVWLEDAEHPGNAILKSNPVFSMRRLLKLGTYHLLFTGSWFWLKVRDQAGFTRELWPLPPGRVNLRNDPETIIRYELMTTSGHILDVAFEDMVRVWEPDPISLFESSGVVERQAVSIDSELFANEMLRTHYQNDATPRIVLKPGENMEALDDEDKKRYDSYWRSAYDSRQGRSFGLPAWLPPGVDAQEFAKDPIAGTLVQLLAQWGEKDLASFGTPGSITGMVQDVNRAAAETNQYTFDVHTVKPITDMVADDLTLQVLVPEYGEDFRYGFREFVPKDKEFLLRRDEVDLRTKIRSVNQVRSDRGMDPVDWGEEPVGTLADVPYRPDESFEDFSNDDEGREFVGGHGSGGSGQLPLRETSSGAVLLHRSDRGSRPDPASFGTESAFMAACVPQVISEGKSQEQAVAQCSSMWENRSRSVARVFPSADMEWARQLLAERRSSPAFAREYRTVLSLQESDVLSRVEKLNPERAPITKAEMKKLRDQVRDLFDPRQWRVEFAKTTEKVRRSTYKASGAAALASVGGEGFELTKIARRQLERQARDFQLSVNKTTSKRLTRTIFRELDESLASGESLVAATRRIERATKGTFKIRRRQAKNIAFTEIGKALETAKHEGWRQSGVVKAHQWNTARDAAVRDSHLIDGQKRPFDKKFLLNSGREARHPRDPNLPAEDSINCRCFTTAIA
ncbi:MAG: phage portal protein [Acidimicrobiia bacterium]